jgi:hypothetical protein
MTENTNNVPGEARIRSILAQYRESFTTKQYTEENDEQDVLMDVFRLTPALKRENRQYWGRELGMCWQQIVISLFQATVPDTAPGWRQADDELCDLIAAGDAIDTKYRIGSGDSGTLKKFKQYGKALRAANLRPLLLILRNDNLVAALGACKGAGWTILTGVETFGYIRVKTGVALDDWLRSLGNEFAVAR